MRRQKKEITKTVERFELIEEKLGVEISGLYATCEHEPDEHEFAIQINFDVTSLTGKFEYETYIASAYNSAGQLLGKGSVSTYGRHGFSSESISLRIDQEPVRIRLFPTRAK